MVTNDITPTSVTCVQPCENCHGKGRVQTYRWLVCEVCYGRGTPLTPLYVAQLADQYEKLERDRRTGKVFR